MRKTVILLIVLLISTGCLKKETLHTVYLDPSGALTWVVLEKNIRSDEPGSAEELQVLTGVSRHRHPMTLGLVAAGALRADSRVLRAERPYWVLSEARFRSVERLARDLLEVLCDRFEVSFTPDPETARLDLECFPADEPRVDDEDPLWELLAADGDFEIRLTAGRFVDGLGFEIVDDGEAARLVQDEDPSRPADTPIRWSLAWTTRVD